MMSWMERMMNWNETLSAVSNNTKNQIGDHSLSLVTYVPALRIQRSTV
jgi:hypothetical protein